MPDLITVALISAASAILVALISGGISVWTNILSNRNLKESKRLSLADQGSDLPSHVSASGVICEKIRDEIKKANQRKGGKPKNVVLSFIGVSMSFSWNSIIEGQLEALIKANPTVNFGLEGVFVDHLFLKDLCLNSEPKNWAEYSEKNEANFHRFGERMRREVGERFVMRVKVIRNLPHWHGWLIGDHHLFLGRVRFTFTKDDCPSMQVGENEYRYYYRTHSGDTAGDARVDLFDNWLQFYLYSMSPSSPTTPIFSRTIWWVAPKPEPPS